MALPVPSVNNGTNTGGRHVDVGFGDILRYVMRHLRMTETKAAFSVKQVLRIGVKMKRIERTGPGRYRLLESKPPGLACKIKEMRTSDEDDEDDERSSESE